MDSKPRPRMTLARAMVTVAACGLVLAMMRPGRRHIETLDSPVGVLSWSEAGIKLDDGRTLPLPGFRRLPLESAALSLATERGVEVRRDGRVIGLIRVHHWCGNDPIREHIARVDLAQMLVFLQQGEPTTPTPLPAYATAISHDDRFSASGWEFGDYHGFASWQRTSVPDS